GIVCGAILEEVNSGKAGYSNDVSLRFLQRTECCLYAVKYTREIRVDGFVPLFFGEVFDRCEVTNTRVGYEDVKSAPARNNIPNRIGLSLRSEERRVGKELECRWSA